MDLTRSNQRPNWSVSTRAYACLGILIVAAFSDGRPVAESFVPFVIPARPNPDSLIAAPPADPINTDSVRLVARSGHFYRGDERVRLWGVNLSFGANLPKHEDAPYIAARLAAAGVNTVRCHHMDTARWPRGLWNAGDGRDIAPEALDRLDFFIDQLARRGICVDINLHVGREHSQFLGLPKTNSDYDKISNIFTPALVDAQKKYARDLLTHVNPYRKARYADDPAVAIVEITNENSFFMWGAEETLRTLPDYYAKILQGRFNTWLKQQYGSDEKLRNAWSEGSEQLGGNLLNNGDFELSEVGDTIPLHWSLEQHGTCKAWCSRQRLEARRALQIDIAEADDTEWHLQFNQPGLALKKGQYYTVAFEAAADKPRSITCSVGQADSPWANLGFSERIDLTEKRTAYRFGFTAGADEDNARLSFAIGASPPRRASRIPVHLANPGRRRASVELRPGGRIGLKEGESVEKANPGRRRASVTLFAETESPARTLDRMIFLAETEKAYFDDMRKFIQKDLGSRALVTGTIVFGPLGLYAQSDMDFIDAHAYWQHPRFPGRPLAAGGRAWDAANWLIDQKPMTDYPGEATLFRLAAERLRGKPFTVSEYNHPAPLDSQAECVPMLARRRPGIASFAAAQDWPAAAGWDGVWLYTYSHSSDDWDRQNLSSYFDIDTNPAKWGFMRAGAAIFREAVVSPVEGRLVAALAASSDIVRHLAQLHLTYDGDMFDAVSAACGATRQAVLSNQLYVSLRPSSAVEPTVQSPTKLTWSVENGKGSYFVGAGADVLAGDTAKFVQARIDSPAYAVITATPLDGALWWNSKKILVTACGRCENTGMKFSDDRRTVGRDWGGPPVQIEAVQGSVTVPTGPVGNSLLGAAARGGTGISNGTGQWKCQALGPDGMPSQQVAVRIEGEQNPAGDGQRHTVELSPKYKTMWYLLTRSEAGEK